MSKSTITSSNQHEGSLTPLPKLYAGSLSGRWLTLPELYSLKEGQANHPFLNTVPISIPNLPAKTYHKISAWGKSSLNNFAKSPAHFKAAIENPKEQTSAMALGSAIHCYVLEPKLFNKEFVVKPIADMRTKVGKAIMERFYEENPDALDKTEVSNDQMEIIKGCRESIMAHPYFRKIIEASGEIELSAFWVDKDSGVFLKGRPDKYTVLNNQLRIFDLKTTTDASPSGFQKQLYNLAYHVQAAMYLDGMSEIENADVESFIFGAVETAAPYVCATYEIDANAIEIGRETYRRYLDKLNDCLKNDKWPGYSDFLQPISLPRYAFMQDTI